MNRSIWSAVVSIGFGAATLIAAPAVTPQPPAPAMQPQPAADTQWPEKVHRAIERTFPGEKVESNGTTDVNGIHVFLIEVSSQTGAVAFGAVTEHGDFLRVGIPVDPKRLPGPVSAIVSRLFGQPPTDVARYTITTYTFNIETNGEHDGVIVDAVGRIKGLHPEAQSKHEEQLMQKEDMLGKSKVIDERMNGMAERFFKGREPKIQHMYPDPTVEHFYHVEITTKDGRQYEVVTNDNDVYAISEKMELGEVPAATVNSVQQMFKGSKIVGVRRREYHYFQFDEMTTGGDKLTMRIGVNGEIMSVASELSKKEEAELEAQNHHQ